MLRFLLALSLSLAFASQALALSCSRATLQQAASRYIAAQSVGQYRYLDALSSPNLTYIEHFKPVALNFSLLFQPLKIDHVRSTFDTSACSAYTELIITDPKHPYVIGTQIRLRNGTIQEVESVVTDKEDWLFAANHTLHYVLLEDWNEIEAEKRDSREVIKAAADAYLDVFNNKNVTVPWGSPCARLEGGLYTQPNDTCATGVPSGVPITDRKYVIDETVGSVDVFSSFGASKLPDTHEFRIEGGKIRYVHTMTVCAEPNCGMKVPPLLSQDPGY